MMDFHAMKRKQLQALCKRHKIPANLSNVEMANRLSSVFNIEDADSLEEQAQSLKNGDGERTSAGDKKTENDVVKLVKKVKFSPQNETFEYVRSDPRAIRLAARKRRSVAPEICSTDEEVIDRETKAEPSRRTRSKSDKVDAKGVVPFCDVYVDGAVEKKNLRKTRTRKRKNDSDDDNIDQAHIAVESELEEKRPEEGVNGVERVSRRSRRMLGKTESNDTLDKNGVSEQLPVAKRTSVRTRTRNHENEKITKEMEEDEKEKNNAEQKGTRRIQKRCKGVNEVQVSVIEHKPVRRSTRNATKICSVVAPKCETDDNTTVGKKESEKLYGAPICDTGMVQDELNDESKDKVSSLGKTVSVVEVSAKNDISKVDENVSEEPKRTHRENRKKKAKDKNGVKTENVHVDASSGAVVMSPAAYVPVGLEKVSEAVEEKPLSGIFASVTNETALTDGGLQNDNSDRLDGGKEVEDGDVNPSPAAENHFLKRGSEEARSSPEQDVQKITEDVDHEVDNGPILEGKTSKDDHLLRSKGRKEDQIEDATLPDINKVTHFNRKHSPKVIDSDNFSSQEMQRLQVQEADNHDDPLEDIDVEGLLEYQWESGAASHTTDKANHPTTASCFHDDMPTECGNASEMKQNQAEGWKKTDSPESTAPDVLYNNEQEPLTSYWTENFHKVEKAEPDVGSNVAIDVTPQNIALDTSALMMENEVLVAEKSLAVTADQLDAESKEASPATRTKYETENESAVEDSDLQCCGHIKVTNPEDRFEELCPVSDTLCNVTSSPQEKRPESDGNFRTILEEGDELQRGNDAISEFVNSEYDEKVADTQIDENSMTTEGKDAVELVGTDKDKELKENMLPKVEEKLISLDQSTIEAENEVEMESCFGTSSKSHLLSEALMVEKSSAVEAENEVEIESCLGTSVESHLLSEALMVEKSFAVEAEDEAEMESCLGTSNESHLLSKALMVEKSFAVEGENEVGNESCLGTSVESPLLSEALMVEKSFAVEAEDEVEMESCLGTSNESHLLSEALMIEKSFAVEAVNEKAAEDHDRQGCCSQKRWMSPEERSIELDSFPSSETICNVAGASHENRPEVEAEIESGSGMRKSENDEKVADKLDIGDEHGKELSEPDKFDENVASEDQSPKVEDEEKEKAETLETRYSIDGEVDFLRSTADTMAFPLEDEREPEGRLFTGDFRKDPTLFEGYDSGRCYINTGEYGHDFGEVKEGCNDCHEADVGGNVAIDVSLKRTPAVTADQLDAESKEASPVTRTRYEIEDETAVEDSDLQWCSQTKVTSPEDRFEESRLVSDTLYNVTSSPQEKRPEFDGNIGTILEETDELQRGNEMPSEFVNSEHDEKVADMLHIDENSMTTVGKDAVELVGTDKDEELKENMLPKVEEKLISLDQFAVEAENEVEGQSCLGTSNESHLLSEALMVDKSFAVKADNERAAEDRDLQGCCSQTRWMSPVERSTELDSFPSSETICMAVASDENRPEVEGNLGGILGFTAELESGSEMLKSDNDEKVADKLDIGDELSETHKFEENLASEDQSPKGKDKEKEKAETLKTRYAIEGEVDFLRSIADRSTADTMASPLEDKMEPDGRIFTGDFRKDRSLDEGYDSGRCYINTGELNGLNNDDTAPSSYIYLEKSLQTSNPSAETISPRFDDTPRSEKRMRLELTNKSDLEFTAQEAIKCCKQQNHLNQDADDMILDGFLGTDGCSSMKSPTIPEQNDHGRDGNLEEETWSFGIASLFKTSTKVGMEKEMDDQSGGSLEDKTATYGVASRFNTPETGVDKKMDDQIDGSPEDKTSTYGVTSLFSTPEADVDKKMDIQIFVTTSASKPIQSPELGATRNVDLDVADLFLCDHNNEAWKLKPEASKTLYGEDKVSMDVGGQNLEDNEHEENAATEANTAESCQLDLLSDCPNVISHDVGLQEEKVKTEDNHVAKNVFGTYAIDGSTQIPVASPSEEVGFDSKVVDVGKVKALEFEVGSSEVQTVISGDILKSTGDEGEYGHDCSEVKEGCNDCYEETKEDAMIDANIDLCSGSSKLYQYLQPGTLDARDYEVIPWEMDCPSIDYVHKDNSTEAVSVHEEWSVSQKEASNSEINNVDFAASPMDIQIGLSKDDNDAITPCESLISNEILPFKSENQQSDAGENSDANEASLDCSVQGAADSLVKETIVAAQEEITGVSDAWSLAPTSPKSSSHISGLGASNDAEDIPCELGKDLEYESGNAKKLSSWVDEKGKVMRNVFIYGTPAKKVIQTGDMKENYTPSMKSLNATVAVRPSGRKRKALGELLI